MKLTIHPKEQKGSVPAHRLEALDLWMSQLVEKKVLPFAMTILQQGEQLLYWRWCGQSQPVSGQPIHAETPLRVYSMTKPVTVLSALMLEEQGLLDLEAPVENWIP
ncbi:MAG: serine hydrolase domain-containing protein, partial [SAR324 cluster bacterium]|nr:serine hydrolase domain-containing protein [SAR324 cluster bacterium]